MQAGLLGFTTFVVCGSSFGHLGFLGVILGFRV